MAPGLSLLDLGHEQTGDRYQLALLLTMRAHLAFERGDDALALGQLRRALRLARDGGLGERMRHAVELAAYGLYRRGRAREWATLVGVVEEGNLRFPRREERMGPLPVGGRASVTQLPITGFRTVGSLVSAEFDEHRTAGRSLSLERAADLALRVIDEELALAPRQRAATGKPRETKRLRPAHVGDELGSSCSGPPAAAALQVRPGLP